MHIKNIKTWNSTVRFSWFTPKTKIHEKLKKFLSTSLKVNSSWILLLGIIWSIKQL